MWHVLQTAPNRERLVSRLLEEGQLSTYVPRFPAGTRTRPGSVRDRQMRCVFPGYLFFRSSSDLYDWSKISRVAGVRRVLLEDGRPGTVPHSLIEHIRRRLHEGAQKQLSDRFIHGEPVLIDHGPLAMLDAIFDRHLDKRTRVQILVHLMGRPLQVRLDAHDISHVAS